MAVQCRRRWLCSLALVPKDASHQVLDIALSKGTGTALLPKDASQQVLDIALHKGKALKKIVSSELVLDFGIHKGKSLAAAPSGYLGWIVQHFRDKEGVKQQWAIHAQKVLDARNARKLAEDQLRRQVVKTLDVSIRQGSVEQVLTQLDSQVDCVDPSLVHGSLLRRCIESRSLTDGKLVHEHILQSGAGKNRYLGNLLILMYGKCGRLDKAWEVFESIHNRNDRTYGIMMSLLQNERPLQALELWQRMEEDGVRADAFIVTSALAACTKLRALEEGKAIHEHLVLSRFKTDEVLDTALLRFYSKCGSVDDAKLVFEGMKTKDLFGWSAIISALNQNGRHEEALVFYRRLVSEGTQPNAVVYASALSACAKLGALEVGRGIHNRVVETGTEQDEVLQDALLNMYARCGVLPEAEAIFQAMEEGSRRIESWTSMMSAYVQAGRFDDALKLYDRLLLASGDEPNEYTFTTVLAACAGLRDVKRGKELHAKVVSAGLEGNAAVQTALVSMYSKCFCPEEAKKVLENMTRVEGKQYEAVSEARNLITLTYAQQGHHLAALELYKRTDPGEQPETMLMSAIEACGVLGALQEGRKLQQRLTELGDNFLLAAAPRLIAMYNSCGSLEDAKQVFNRLESSENCVNEMLAAYASSSQDANQAVLEFRQKMLQEGLRLDASSCLLAVLWSLRGEADRTEAVEQAKKEFQAALNDEAVVSLLEHYLCIVELLGRAGKLTEAEQLLETMPYEAPATGWLLLLRACKASKDLIRGERIAAKVFAKTADDAEPYVLLANMYDEAGRDEDAARIRRRMVSRFGSAGSGGHSLIETDSSELHKFESNDEVHPRIEEVRSLLLGLSEPLKQAGYTPCTREVIDDDSDEQAKERQLCFHSERLAVGYGLLTAEDEVQEPMRVIKTVGKMCNDCHKAVKVMSDVVERRIMVRDASGFHWFHQGACSCGDYW